MAEILFYHLTEQPLEKVLPGLLEKCRQRDWSVVVQSNDADQCKRLDEMLWQYRDTAFLPHSVEQDTEDFSDHAIVLTHTETDPISATVRFVIDRAMPPDLSAYKRAIYLFDGHDIDAVAHARERWKAEKASGHDITYWQQTPMGGWEKKA